MSSERIDPTFGLRAFGLTLMLAFSLTALCQVSAAQESAPAASETPAEDFSYRKKSVSRLRREFENAEEDFYAMFNDVNDDDDFDVQCKKSATIGSRKKERHCKALFLWKYEANVALTENDRIRGGSGGGDSLLNAAAIDEKQVQLRQKISAAVAANPALNESFGKLVHAKRQYDAKLQER